MEQRMLTSRGGGKVPTYVPIYDMLYADIINGVYPSGSQLPGETQLSEKYAVSRNTLRQALTILAEDGLISKAQGKGTFISYDACQREAPGTIFNPMVRCAKAEIDSIETTYNYGPPTEVAQRKLALKASEVVLAGNNVFCVKGRPVGHSFVQIPVRYLGELEIDLNDEAAVGEAINQKIFDLASSVQMTIKLVLAEENVTTFLHIPNEMPILFLEELLYNHDGQAVARCKFYFIPEEYELVFKNG